VEFHRDFWPQKARVPELSHGVVGVILRVSRLGRSLNCDRRMDGRSHDDNIWVYRVSI